VAKTEAAHASLARQLRARAIRRRYVAVVEGRLPLETGTVNAPIGRHLTHRKEMTVRHLGGRAAVTHYRVLARRHTPFLHTVIEVSLETGRTHQIRVHMAHLGYPVFGDPTYGAHPPAFWRSHGVTRQLLHAHRLAFQHPATGRPLTLTAPTPADFAPWLAGLPLQANTR
jgi:23S rRNA pseudouridine1911/1915/1917 synthase